MSGRSSVAARGAAVLFALGLIVALGVRDARADGPQDLVGKAAPNFSLTTVDGKSVKLSDLKGNVVVVDFWATWCGPCKASLPHIQKLSEDKDKAKDGLRVLAVNAREEKAAIEPFLQQNKYTFAVPMDAEGKTMEAYGVEGIPTTIVVGRDGKVHAAFVGFNPQEGGKDLDKAVEDALKAK